MYTHSYFIAALRVDVSLKNLQKIIICPGKHKIILRITVKC